MINTEAMVAETATKIFTDLCAREVPHQAEAGHYPAIDIEQSISRAMHSITTPEHQKLTRRLKQLYSRYQRNRDLISVGAYSAGSDPVLDEAILLNTRIEDFLQQDIRERATISESMTQLSSLFGG